jgi:hypothetical protein
VVEHLPSKHKTLSSTLVPERKEGRKEGEREKKEKREGIQKWKMGESRALGM